MPQSMVGFGETSSRTCAGSDWRASYDTQTSLATLPNSCVHSLPLVEGVSSRAGDGAGLLFDCSHPCSTIARTFA